MRKGVKENECIQSKIEQLAKEYYDSDTDDENEEDINKDTYAEDINKEENINKNNITGYVRPCYISDELATFLGKEKGIITDRLQVTSGIAEYIRLHNLYRYDNRYCMHIIQPDEKLKCLLNLKEEDILTFNNLQKYLKHHFPN